MAQLAITHAYQLSIHHFQGVHHPLTIPSIPLAASHLSFGLLTLGLIVLLVKTDAHGRYKRHIHTGRDRHRIRLLAKHEVLAAELLALDACNGEI
jgi:hypothetical protein